MNASAFFKTDHAERYLGTLCKHFGHKVPVDFDRAQGRIDLPMGRCRLAADARGLDLSVNAGDRHALDRLIQVITSHLERFAFRENPTLTWTVADHTGF